MNIPFADYHSAAICGAGMRNQGYFVNILHENAGSLWVGPATGFIVECSEEPIEIIEDLKVYWEISDWFTVTLSWAMVFCLVVLAAQVILTVCTFAIEILFFVFRGDRELGYDGAGFSIYAPAIQFTGFVIACLVIVSLLRIIADRKRRFHASFMELMVVVGIVICINICFP